MAHSDSSGPESADEKKVRLTLRADHVLGAEEAIMGALPASDGADLK